MRIAICDIGSGNIASVARALHRAAADAGKPVTIEVTRDLAWMRDADKIVVPGQGSFGDCARSLTPELRALLMERLAKGMPYLGICLGLQVLFEASEEAPDCEGLGFFPGNVVRLRAQDFIEENGPLKIPHMGWNTIDLHKSSRFLPTGGTYFYFVHSFVVRPNDPAIIAATTTYGVPFVSAVERDNIFACQFHPEKSQVEGLSLLTRFLLT